LQDSLVEQSSQGNLVPQGPQDILFEVIGRPEHPGHLRVAGKAVGNQHYFRAAPRHSSPASETKAEMASRIQQELMEEMKKDIERVWLEFEVKNCLLRQEFLS